MTRSQVSSELPAGGVALPFATIDGIGIHYEIHGDSGPWMVLLHGYTGDASDWRYQIEAFSKSHRILVLDNRGHGRSESPADVGAFTVEAMADDATALIDQVGIDRYHLVGHSIGGAVAQEIALRQPRRLLSLTLQDTTDWFGDHEEPGGTRPYVPPEEARRAAERARGMSRSALAGAWKGLLSWRGSSERVHSIRAPTLVVYGSRDASRIIEGSRRLAASIPGAEVAVIQGAGHSPQRERARDFNSVLRRFIESRGG